MNRKTIDMVTFTDDNGNPLWLTFTFANGQKMIYTDINTKAGNHVRLTLSHPKEGKYAGKTVLGRSNGAEVVLESVDDANKYIRENYDYEGIKISSISIDGKPLFNPQAESIDYSERLLQIQKDFEQSQHEMDILHTEIVESNPDLDKNIEGYTKEVSWRLINNYFDVHGFWSDLNGRVTSENENEISEINSDIMGECDSILTKVADEYTEGKIEYKDIQGKIDEGLKSNELYCELQLKGYLTDFCSRNEKLNLGNLYENLFERKSITEKHEINSKLYHEKSASIEFDNFSVQKNYVSNKSYDYELYEKDADGNYFKICTDFTTLTKLGNKDGKTVFMTETMFDNHRFSLPDSYINDSLTLPLSYFAEKTDLASAQVLWFELGNVPVDENANLDEEFLWFKKGTDREEVWHWIEEHYDLSVAEMLMYDSISFTEYEKRRNGNTGYRDEEIVLSENNKENIIEFTRFFNDYAPHKNLSYSMPFTEDELKEIADCLRGDELTINQEGVLEVRSVSINGERNVVGNSIIDALIWAKKGAEEQLEVPGADESLISENTVALKNIEERINQFEQIPLTEIPINQRKNITESGEKVLSEQTKLSPVQLAGEKFIGTLKEKLPYHNNNPWVTANVILSDMKKSDPAGHSELLKFFDREGLTSKKAYDVFFEKNLGIKKHDIERQSPSKEKDNDYDFER